MGFKKRKLGDLIALVDERNTLGIRTFVGINIQKEFMPTAATTSGLDERKYKIVRKSRFVFSGMQTGRDRTIRLAMYADDDPALVSPAYTTFEVSRPDLILPEYLFMRFLSPEMDRYGWFLSDGSVRANLDWEEFCDIDFLLPRIAVQQKFVDLHKGISVSATGQQDMAESSRAAFEASIEQARSTYPYKRIGAHVRPSDIRNGSKLGLEALRGISVDKVFIPTKANMTGVSLNGYKIVQPGEIAFVPVTSRNGERLSVAINTEETEILISAINQVFRCDRTALLPEYLMLFLSRPEFDRYARFHSWGSARETFNWDDMCDVKIPLPPIEVQESITALSRAHFTSSGAASRTRELLKKLCPVLIKGSLDEARREVPSA